MNVTVVLCVLNNMPYLPKWFETYRAKTKMKVDLIVVDNGSTDGSIEFCEKQNDIYKLIKVGRNTGSTGAWNRGILASKTQWVALMNSDIEFTYDGWLERFMKETKDDVGLIECLEVIWNHETRWAGGAGFLINKKMVEDVGLFDEKTFWGFCGDTDFWIRLIWHKWKMAWCKDVLYFHWCGGTHNRGCLKDRSRADWEEGRKNLYRKWTAETVFNGWEKPRKIVEAWLQEQRKAGRLQ